MTHPTPPTSGAADLPEALINIAREIEALKRNCGPDPESPIAIQNGRYMALSYKVRALAAQAISAEPAGAVYAELPNSLRTSDISGDPSDRHWASGYYNADHMRDFADRTHALRASHGQASAQPLTVAQVEEAIGLRSKAWDTIGAEKIVEAVLHMVNGQAPAQPDCLTCNDHGAVGNILTAEPCPDCTPSPQVAQQAPAERSVQRMDGWTDTRYITELENVVRLLRRDLEKLHKVREALSDCSGGQPCSTCPDKKACQRGCVRQEEFISTEYHAQQRSRAAQQAPAGATSPWSRALEIRIAQGWKLKGDRLPVLYTDTINGDGVGRDDLWLCTTSALAVLAAPSTPAYGGWISVKDQLPPCRDDQDYIGINSAGFAGIFNAVADIAGNVYCMMETAEESVSIMSDLSIWKPFTRPLPASPTIEGESNG